MCSSFDFAFPIFNKSLPPVNKDVPEASAYLVDKPLGWSSFRVVGLMRKLLDIKKVGHAGTLDPMATGLLIVCAGKKATKEIHLFQNAEKEYRTEITFGYSTASYDSETPPVEYMDYDHLKMDDIQQCIHQHFHGEILQTPPMFAAIKQNGVPLYKLARKGQIVEREPRRVSIHHAEVHSFKPPVLDLTIRCSKGTYIRSISNDLGELLGTRSHMSALRRTAIGSYAVSEALTIQELCNYLDPDGKFDISI
ncbi:MAG: tRNA pseudouridine(55) synthase TruB [Balneolales bacterium]|nr:tRNA pseudouridine(55) synthase TruB [Balneolales bacterium]